MILQSLTRKDVIIIMIVYKKSQNKFGDLLCEKYELDVTNSTQRYCNTNSDKTDSFCFAIITEISVGGFGYNAR